MVLPFMGVHACANNVKIVDTSAKNGSLLELAVIKICTSKGKGFCMLVPVPRVKCTLFANVRDFALP